MGAGPFLGAGLGQMFSGATQGMAQGTLQRMALDRQDRQDSMQNKLFGLRTDQMANETAKSQMDQQMHIMKMTGQILAPVVNAPDDQTAAQLWPIALQQASTMFPGVQKLIESGKIPTQYDANTKAWATSLYQASIPIEKQFEAQNKAPVFHDMITGDNSKQTIMAQPGKPGITSLGQSGQSGTGANKSFWSGEGPLTGSDEILANMVATGDLAPMSLSKRTGNFNAVLARAKQINPDFVPRQEDMDFSAGRTSSFRSKDITMQSIPAIIENVVKAGKAVNYDPIRFVGMAQAWKNKQLNDPAQVEYMALRNDALLSIAGVMRGTGATDQAHKVEMEAMDPTLPPAALDAWAKAQFESFKPRMEQYDKIYHRDKPDVSQQSGSTNWQTQQSDAPPLGSFAGKPEGEPTRFKNGQVWTIKGGTRVRLQDLEGQ